MPRSLILGKALESRDGNTIFDFRFSIKELGITVSYPGLELISIPVTPEWWSVGSGPLGVGECGIIDLDFIIPIQPKTISDPSSSIIHK